MIKKWVARLFGFEKLQKAHDLRALLNSRLSAENTRLRLELNRPRPKKKLSAGAQQHIEQMATAHSRKMRNLHLESQRQNLLADFLRDHVSEEVFLQCCAEVKAMTDEQVTAYVKPKRAGSAA